MITPGIYRHFKGNKYRVHGIAAHCDSLERFVVYSRLYEPGPLDVKCDFFVRSETDFEAIVIVEEKGQKKDVPRFKQITRPRAVDKGPEFERVTCKQLSLWVSKGQRDDLFGRTASSGGQATQALKKGKQRTNTGDIACVDPMGFEFTKKILVECKHWRDLDLIALFNQRGELYTHIEKVKKQAAVLKKDWCFVAKQNNKATLFMVSGAFALEILHSLYVADPEVAVLTDKRIYIFNFEDILKYLTHEQLLSCCQQPNTTGEAPS